MASAKGERSVVKEEEERKIQVGDGQIRIDYLEKEEEEKILAWYPSKITEIKRTNRGVNIILNADADAETIALSIGEGFDLRIQDARYFALPVSGKLDLPAVVTC